MREVITLRVGGQQLVGTAHRPPGGPPRSPAPTGVLLLNPGPAPRAGNSDLSARLGDHLASLGFPAFRVDLPGLGDSEGDLPVEEQVFWQSVQAGRNDLVTLEIVEALRREQGIARVVLGGLCAGALTSLRVAARDPEARSIAGLLVLEPNLRLDMKPLEKSGPDGVPRPDRWAMVKRKLRQALLLRHWLHLLTGEGRLARLAAPARPLLRRWLRRLAGHDLPWDANVELVLSWLGTIARSLPTLLVTASGYIDERDCRRVLESVAERHRRSVTHVSIPHTNHILTAGDAAAICLTEAGRWAEAHFAVPRR